MRKCVKDCFGAFYIYERLQVVRKSCAVLAQKCFYDGRAVGVGG